MVRLFEIGEQPPVENGIRRIEVRLPPGLQLRQIARVQRTAADQNETVDLLRMPGRENPGQPGAPGVADQGDRASPAGRQLFV